MKTATVALLGLSFNVSARPETATELNERAVALTGDSATDVALEEATSNLDYRTYYPKIRSAISDGIEALGFPRRKETSQGKTREVTKYTETEAKHIARAKADGIVTDADIRALGQTFCDNNPWDVVCLSTASRAKSFPKDIIAQAETMLESIEDWSRVEAKIGTLIPGFVLDLDDDGAPSSDTLCRALVMYRDAATKTGW